MAYLKPQTPIQDFNTGDYIYPLTTIDQVVMSDGSRLNNIFKHSVKKEATLLASNWSSEAPYTQAIALGEDVTDLKVDANIIYSGDYSIDRRLNQASSCLSYIKKNGKEIICYCLKDKPEIDIPVEIIYESSNGIGIVGAVTEGFDLDTELAAQAELIAELQVALQDKMSGRKLNFEIVGGTTEPSNPAENTIWVNTDTEITSWFFGNEYKGRNLLKANKTSETLSGITFTVNSDGSVTASGTLNSTVADFDYVLRSNKMTLPAGSYILSGCPLGGGEDSYSLIIGSVIDGVETSIVAEYGEEVPFTLLEKTEIYVLCRIKTTEPVSDLTFYPMIRLASEKNSTYIPYGDGEDGAVWILTGASSPVPFKVVTDSDIIIYPLSAKQYVGGKWVDKTVKSWQDGEWVAWWIYLLNFADKCEGITGGYVLSVTGSPNGTGTSDDNGLSVSMTWKSASPWSQKRGYYTANKIDVSKYKTLVAEGNVSTKKNKCYAYLSLSSTSGVDNLSNVAFVYSDTTGDFTLELDLTEITGEYYVMLYVGSYIENATSSQYPSITATYNRVYLK